MAAAGTTDSKILKDCVTILSHGQYNYDAEGKVRSFKIPDNIQLVQYALPDKLLILIDAVMVLDLLRCGIENNGVIYLVNKNNGTIFKTNTFRSITQPGEDTTSLKLTFENQTVVGDIRYGYKNVLGDKKDVWQPYMVKTNKNLEDMLNIISMIYKQNEETKDKIVRVVQLSCYTANNVVMCDREFSRDLIMREQERLKKHASIPYLSTEEFVLITDKCKANTTREYIDIIKENYQIVYSELEAIQQSMSFLELNKRKIQIGGKKQRIKRTKNIKRIREKGNRRCNKTMKRKNKQNKNKNIVV